MPAARLSPEHRRFLRERPFVGTVTVLRPDGSPHSTVVWVDEDGGDVVFNTVIGRAKERYLRADPRAAMLVADPRDPYKWVGVSGTAALSTEAADAHIDKLSQKYLGRPYPWHKPDEQRVVVRISVDRVDSHGF